MYDNVLVCACVCVYVMVPLSLTALPSNRMNRKFLHWEQKLLSLQHQRRTYPISTRSVNVKLCVCVMSYVCECEFVRMRMCVILSSGERVTSGNRQPEDLARTGKQVVS